MAELRPIKRLGQNFLVDPVWRERVVSGAGIRPEDEVLEVGAGPGTITAALVEAAARVVAVEVDRRQIPTLRSAAPQAEVIVGDILQVDLAGLFPQGGEVVVGNIPYYLSGALLPKLLQQPPRPRRLSLVVQREVARRWCGLEGWSLATVAVQTLAEAHIEFELPPEAFRPRPKVHSALIILEVRPNPAVATDLDAFFRFVEAVFQFRRKQLAGSLARITGQPRAALEASLGEIGLDPSRRPQSLSVPEWDALFKRMTGIA